MHIITFVGVHHEVGAIVIIAQLPNVNNCTDAGQANAKLCVAWASALQWSMRNENVHVGSTRLATWASVATETQTNHEN